MKQNHRGAAAQDRIGNFSVATLDVVHRLRSTEHPHQSVQSAAHLWICDVFARGQLECYRLLWHHDPSDRISQQPDTRENCHEQPDQAD